MKRRQFFKTAMAGVATLLAAPATFAYPDKLPHLGPDDTLELDWLSCWAIKGSTEPVSCQARFRINGGKWITQFLDCKEDGRGFGKVLLCDNVSFRFHFDRSA